MKIATTAILLFAFACNVPDRSTDEVCVKGSSAKVSKATFDDLYKGSISDKRYIEIEGFFAYSFEDHALYVDRRPDTKKALWLSFSRDLEDRDSLLKKISGKKVSIMGQYDPGDKGHLNSYYGGISNVYCIKWED